MLTPENRAGPIRFAVSPRLVPPVKAARRLGLTLAEFEAKREALIRIGMPSPCPVTGNYDLTAIDDWLDRRAAIGSAAGMARDARLVFEERLATYGSR